MKKIDWKRVRQVSRNLFRATLKGELVLKFDRFLPHILVLVVLCSLSIWVNLRMDRTMVQCEQNRIELQRLKIVYDQKVCDLAQIRQVNNVTARLSTLGIDVSTPEKPATMIQK